ncbi:MULTISPECIES: hypothetical protein [Helicobacter]|uniref:Predicted membrane-associated n=2 Tax=Helicobacter typhlonius TaxID=76936 RepID=A0A099UFD4_9HELI|nr:MULTISPECIES: hypothetical protein [Helicobacter]TLD78950.1 hypothetical protein LS75_004170 [Helicobacter typhlonius]TLD90283.1 hypothetical protein LS67_001095 [Helicobacter sp. MIT 03-1616]CUU40973.1 predicted membrane-associated [Helicobacter typhlonius]HCD73429.1 hypothetical protein [Helicobacter sp.]
MRFKPHLAYLAQIQKHLYHFLSTKTTREKYLLFTATSLCVIFIMLDFVYMPLFERLSTLRQLHSHTQNEYNLSLDSVYSAKNEHLEQMYSLHSSLEYTKENLALLQEYFDNQEPLLNPYTFMPPLIEFAKTSHLTLFAFTPNPALNALSVEGMGHFDDIVALLAFIESHRFFSIDYMHFTSSREESIYFSLQIIDYRLQKQISEDSQPKQNIKEVRK